MTIESIFESVRTLESKNIYELYEIFGIEIYYTPLLITHDRDSMIICDGTHKGVFIRPNPDPKYIQFLLWHEFGHYILHWKPNMRMNYYLSTRWRETEQQANIFAVINILQYADSRSADPVRIAISNGVPYQIAIDSVNRIRYYLDSLDSKGNKNGAVKPPLDPDWTPVPNHNEVE